MACDLKWQDIRKEGLFYLKLPSTSNLFRGFLGSLEVS